MSISKNLIFAAGASILATFSGQASTQNFHLSVEGSLNSVDFGRSYSVDEATGDFQMHSRMVYTDPNAVALDGLRWVNEIRSTTGSLDFSLDQTDPYASPLVSNCTGFLSYLCSGSYLAIDIPSRSFTSSDYTSFLVRMNSSSLIFDEDSSFQWTDGSRSFSSFGYGIQISYDIDSVSIAPVPLPSGLALMLGALGLLVGVRRKLNS